MKHSHFEKLIKKAGTTIELSSTEKEKTRSMLREYIAFKPIRRQEPEVLPFYRGALDTLASLTRRPALSFAAVVLMVALSSGGVAFASESSLPGDVLYPVKVNFLEPVQVSLALSTNERAARHRTFAERRMNEAALLAEQGRLSTTTEASLVANFEYNAAAGRTGAARQDTEDEDDGTAIPSANFAAHLSAYENVMAQIGIVRGQNSTLVFQKSIRAQLAKTASTTRPRAHARNNNVEELKTAANTALNISTKLLGSVRTTLSASTSIHAQEALEDARTFTQEGNGLLNDNDVEGASQAFKNSLDATARFSVFTHAAVTLKVDAFATVAATSTLLHKGLYKKDSEKTNSPQKPENPASTTVSSVVPVNTTVKRDEPTDSAPAASGGNSPTLLLAPSSISGPDVKLNVGL